MRESAALHAPGRAAQQVLWLTLQQGVQEGDHRTMHAWVHHLLSYLDIGARATSREGAPAEADAEPPSPPPPQRA